MSRRRVILSDSEPSDNEREDGIVQEHERMESNSQRGDSESDEEIHGDQRSHGSVSPVRDISDSEVNNDNAAVANNDENNENADAKKVDPPKKRIVGKREVLNCARLKGPKGIHTIEKLFEGFKFKGPGREKEDLDRVMKRLEYWGFRLYPKLDFDDILSKCEALGHKKELQTFLKRYRLGMLTSDDVVENVDIQEEEEAPIEPIESVPNPRQQELYAQIQNEIFDDLFNEAF